MSPPASWKQFWPAWLPMLFVLAVNATSALTAFGQVASGSLDRLNPRLRSVPEQPPRPSLFQAEPLGPPQAAVDSFLDSIKGNDAAFRVVVGQGRLLTLKQRISQKDKSAAIAVGDPSIIDFQILPNPRLIRILGLRPGVTDLSITTADDETISLEVHVTYDLHLLEARLRQLFPSAMLQLGQLRDHVIVEGQARSTLQSAQIVEALEAYLQSMQAEVEQQGRAFQQEFIEPDQDSDPRAPRADDESDEQPPRVPEPASVEQGGIETARAQLAQARVINLLRVPGVQQVLLKVRIAELNRTALREIGADVLGVDPSTGNILGTRIGGASVSAAGTAGLGGLLSEATSSLGSNATAFGIFPSGDFQIIFRALRDNGFLRVLAEPNLIAMSGHQADFLAGGEFPVPVPQGAGAVNTTTTVQFREFGVKLEFLPYVIEEDRIRLSVIPEVSTIDFALGTTLVAGGDPVPGLNTRRASTTVELNQGQTLAMAGLLQVELAGRTNRIPGLGDLPYLGPLFSNSSHRRVEKELVVLVTPYLVEGIDAREQLPLPGESIEDPTDHELFIHNQYEGQTGVNHRATVEYGPRHARRRIRHEKQVVPVPVGFSD